MKKKTIKKLNLNKEEISNLSNEESQRLIGGNDAPTWGDNCTNTCENLTIGYGNCTAGCTGGCPSQYGTGCNNGTLYDCLISAYGGCHSNLNCTYAQCTGTCPTSYGDPTC